MISQPPPSTRWCTRDDDRLRAVADLHHGLLEAFEEAADLVELPHRDGHRDLAEVRADGEVRPLVADHEASEVAVVLDLVDGLAQPLHHLLPERVRFAPELEERDAVAQVEEGSLAVLPERAALVLLDDGEADFVGRKRVGDVRALAGHPHLALAVLLFVEALGGHVANPLGDLDAFGFQVVADAVHAEGVPHLERAELPAKAPRDGAVKVGRAVGDLGNPAGAVAEEVERGLAEELPDAAVVFVELREPIFELAALERADVEPALGRVLVLHRPHVDGLDRLALLLVKPGLRLRPEPVALDELVEDVRYLKGVAALVVGDGVVEVLCHMPERVEADHVGGAEGRALGVADELAGELVDLLDRVVALGGLPERLHHGVDADPVADKVRGVLGDDDAFAQVDTREVRHALDDGWVGVGRRDHLEQLEVARRVEKVGPEKAPLEVAPSPLGDLADREARGIRRDHRTVARVLLDPGHHLLLDVHPLDHDLDDPIDGADPVEVVVEVSQRDALLGGVGEERRGVHLRRRLEGALDD